jgi:type III restriction enzyme
VKAIGSNVAQYVTVKTFVDELRKLVVEELQPQLLNEGRLLSETPPFPWSRRTLNASKCIFNLVPCENAFEEEFARLLQKRDDVERFAKLRINLASRSITRMAQEIFVTTSLTS